MPTCESVEFHLGTRHKVPECREGLPVQVYARGYRLYFRLPVPGSARPDLACRRSLLEGRRCCRKLGPHQRMLRSRAVRPMPGGSAINDGFSCREFTHDRRDRHHRALEATGQRTRPAFSHPAQRIHSAPAEVDLIPVTAVAHFISQRSDLHLQHVVIPQAGWRAHRRPPLLLAGFPSRRAGVSTDTAKRPAPDSSVSSPPTSARSSPAQSSSARTPCRASTACCASACDILKSKSSSAESSNILRSCIEQPLPSMTIIFALASAARQKGVSCLLGLPPMTH